MKEQEKCLEIYQYIKKSSGKKVGLIKAIKVNSEIGPVVIITHSCCNIKHDKFNEKIGHEICDQRALYCLNIIEHYEPKRTKKIIDKKLTRTLKRQYKKMVDRCVKYFKDISSNNIFMYYTFFEYV